MIFHINDRKEMEKSFKSFTCFLVCSQNAGNNKDVNLRSNIIKVNFVWNVLHKRFVKERKKN